MELFFLFFADFMNNGSHRSTFLYHIHHFNYLTGNKEPNKKQMDIHGNKTYGTNEYIKLQNNH